MFTFARTLLSLCRYFIKKEYERLSPKFIIIYSTAVNKITVKTIWLTWFNTCLRFNYKSKENAKYNGCFIRDSNWELYLLILFFRTNNKIKLKFKSDILFVLVRYTCSISVWIKYIRNVSHMWIQCFNEWRIV